MSDPVCRICGAVRFPTEAHPPEDCNAVMAGRMARAREALEGVVGRIRDPEIQGAVRTALHALLPRHESGE